jgi:hypothetical protein
LLSGCGGATTAASPAIAPRPSVTPVPTVTAVAPATPIASATTTATATATPVPTESATAATGTGHSLDYDLNHAGSCATLAANFTYIHVDEVSTRDGQSSLTYRTATMHCGGPDDYQYLLQPGTHHVFVDADAEVVLIHEGADGIVEVPSTAAKLAEAYAAQKGAYPTFAIRHSSVGHAAALVQRFHP